MIRYTFKCRGMKILFCAFVFIVGLTLFFTAKVDSLLSFVIQILFACALIHHSTASLFKVFAFYEGKFSRLQMVDCDYSNLCCSDELISDKWHYVCQNNMSFFHSVKVSEYYKFPVHMELVPPRKCFQSRWFFEQLVIFAKVIEKTHESKLESNKLRDVPLVSRLVPDKKMIFCLDDDIPNNGILPVRIADRMDDLFTNQSTGKSLRVLGKEINNTFDFMPVYNGHVWFKAKSLKESPMANGLRLICLYKSSDDCKIDDQLFPSRLICESFGWHNFTLDEIIRNTLSKRVTLFNCDFDVEIHGYLRLCDNALAPAIVCTVTLEATIESINQRATSLAKENGFIFDKFNSSNQNTSPQGDMVLVQYLVNGGSRH